MPCVASFEFAPFRDDVWRIVEGQYFTTTRKLVDSQQEQDLLEALIDSAKPQHAQSVDPEQLHYLLHTPFRYSPLRHGSRFGSVYDRGIWYGALKPETAMAEVSFYKFLFLDASEFDFEPMQETYSVFSVAVMTEAAFHCVDSLTAEALEEITRPDSYDHSIRLGQNLRETGCELILYPSARDKKKGICVAIFTPAVFATPKAPQSQQEWTVFTDAENVEWRWRNLMEDRRYLFSRLGFEQEGRLPFPSV